MTHTRFGEFGERHAAFGATAHVVDFTAVDCNFRDLFADQTIEVLHMEHVANLQASTAEPVIGQRSAKQVASRPEDDKTLVDLPHLPPSRQHPATVYDSAQSIKGHVF